MRKQKIEAHIVARMWTNGITGVNSLPRSQVATEFVGHVRTERALEIIDEMVADPGCPLRGAEDMPVTLDYGEAHVSLSADAVAAVRYLDGKGLELWPPDLERMR